MKCRNSFNNPKSGQSILEVIIAMGIFALISAAMIAMVTGSFAGLVQGGEQTEAEGLAQEGIEAARSIRDGAWNELRFATSSVSATTSQWAMNGENTTEEIGQYTRTISFHDVCRDINDDITDCTGDYTDPHSKKVISSITWDTDRGKSNTVERIAYISNWDSQDWTQTNWFGGAGQTNWSDTTKFDTNDGNVSTTTAGQISIISGDTEDDGFDVSGDSSLDWPFTTASNYTYDADDIVVTGAFAQLVGSGGSTVTGDTLNPDFDIDTNNWTYADWEQGGGIDVTGSRIATGGNPNGYVNVSIPGKKNDTSSGYWEQSFVTTEDNPQIATTTLDWIITEYSSTLLTSFKLYVFVDSASGDPTVGTEVWTSGEITSTTEWASVGAIDVSSKLGLAGTYYLKIAARRIMGGGAGSPGTNTAGFDNVKLHWEKTLPAVYPSDSPDIYPKTSETVTGLESWNSFSETAEKDGGEIYYQISHDDGTTWQYWDGSAWTVTTATSSNNLASVINTNISSFTTVNSQIKPRAFLESNSSQLVQLDNINIGFVSPGSFWTFRDWDVDGGEVTPTGAHNTSGGNPGNYNSITVPRGGGDEVGGYWEQPFKTYRDNPTGDSINFDYKIIDFNDTPNVAHIRIYVDTASGDPVTQVGSSISFSAEGDWTSAVEIDPSSAITTQGEYYLKVAVWIETPAGGGANATGPFTIGFDNVNIDLGNGEHPTSGVLTSSAFNNGTASTTIQIVEWDETTPSSTYTAELEISGADDSSGSPGTWSNWYGSGGAGTQFTNASGTIISTDLNGYEWVRYRATLSGDGDDTPTVQEVRVNYK